MILVKNKNCKMFHLEMAIYFSRETGRSCSETETSLEVEGKKCRKPFFASLFCENISIRSIPMQTSHANTIPRFQS